MINPGWPLVIRWTWGDEWPWPWNNLDLEMTLKLEMTFASGLKGNFPLVTFVIKQVQILSMVCSVLDQVPQDFWLPPTLIGQIEFRTPFLSFYRKDNETGLLPWEWISRRLESSLTTSRGTTQLSLCRLQIERELESTLKASLTGLMWDP